MGVDVQGHGRASEGVEVACKAHSMPIKEGGCLDATQLSSAPRRGDPPAMT